MSPLRTRLAVGLVALAVIGLELSLMRFLALRFWQYFAYMVISVALLGFGASGTVLTLLRRRVARAPDPWFAGSALAFAASILLTQNLASHVPLNVQFLAWDLGQLGYVFLLELVIFVPFFFSGCVIGVALMDSPERVGGHYAANLFGSGVGGVAAVLLMHVLRTDQLFVALTAAALLAGALALPWQRPGRAVLAMAAAVGVAGAAWLLPPGPTFSEYKILPQILAMPGTETLYRTEGPLGRLDVVAGPALHYAPGLSLQYTESLPPQVLLISDGDSVSAVYDCRRREDWAFLDYTTRAAPYHVRRPAKVLAIGAGGGSDIGLALYHEARALTALEINPDVISAMSGPLAERGGGVYKAPGVQVVQMEARGFLASSKEAFDLIQLPEIEAFGAAGAGLFAAQESYLYTVESFAAMLDHLADGGLLCVTRWAHTPPRDGLRVLDTAAQALRARGFEPAAHLAMLRSWVTDSVLVSKTPLEREDCARLRAFCRARSFDVCFLPDSSQSEENRFHVLDRPYYFEGAQALLGPQRREFLDRYPFRIEAATDDRPYFGHFFRWSSLPMFWEQLGGRARAYLEVGHLMLVAALIQLLLLSAVLLLLPLACAPVGQASSLSGGRQDACPTTGEAEVRAVRNKAAALGYFLLIGVGFMLLEMGFMQRLILYLAHPIYAAAVVISAFLVFGGVGSAVCRCWPASPPRVCAAAALGVALIAAAYLLGLDSCLRHTQGAPAGVRFLVAGAAIAPLAVAMGHMFPSALRQLGAAAPQLVPWAWGVNGFASVIATVAAPLLAVYIGFAWLTLAAAACYLLAGLAARGLAACSASSRYKAS